jgi:hypothetical protein
VTPKLSGDVIAASTPKPANLLGWVEFLGGIVLALIACYLAATESLRWLPFVLGSVVGLVAVLTRWPDGVIVGLLIAGSVPRWFFPVGNWNAKPEHVVAAVCAVVVLFRFASGVHTWKRFDKLDILLLGFLAGNFVSSSLFSPERASTLRWSLLQTLAAAPFFLIGQLITTRDHFDRVVRWWLYVGAMEAAFGILCFFSHILLGTSVGVTLFFYIGFIPGVHGSLWEPNIFGSYCTCFAVMSLVYYLADKSKNVYMVTFVLSTVGLLLSLARQAWACLIFVGGFIFLYHLRHNLHPKKTARQVSQWKRFAFAAAAVIVALSVALTGMRQLSDRLSTLSLTEIQEDPTLIRRVGLLVLAVQDIQQHPIVGLGSSSFQLLYLGEDDSYEGVGQAWLGTLFFRIVHDTGIIGTFLLGWFIINLGRRAWRVFASHDPPNTGVGALLAGAVVMLIAYQFTDATTLAFTWIHLGLLAAGVQIAERDSSSFSPLDVLS